MRRLTACSRASRLSEARAEEAERRARERTQERGGELGAQADVDYFRAEQALKRAENRLNVSRRAH